MPKMIDLTGKTFGRLTVIKSDHIASNGEAKWLCKCECGKIASVKGYNLRTGQTKSCGCWQKDARITHGHTANKFDTPTYKTWENMIQRCTNPKHHHWLKYGGAGITVCDRWRNYANFLADMGERPIGCTIDRIDNSESYKQENCRWATIKQQQRNRNACRLIEFNSETKTMVEWSESLGIPYATLESRLRKGMSLEKAFTQRPLIGRLAFQA